MFRDPRRRVLQPLLARSPAARLRYVANPDSFTDRNEKYRKRIGALGRWRAWKNSDNRLFSRESSERGEEILADRQPVTRIDRAEAHSTRLFPFVSAGSGIESNRMESNQDRVASETMTSKTYAGWDAPCAIGAPPSLFTLATTCTPRGSCLPLVVPSSQPRSPLPEYRFVGHYRELPMENVIDSERERETLCPRVCVCLFARNDNRNLATGSFKKPLVDGTNRAA